MSQPDSGHPCSPAGSSQFATTHWSVVIAAGHSPASDGTAALEHLCRAYWYPLYAYTRRHGFKPEDAEDITQEFFARLLAKEYLGLADPARGRFRTFLLSALKNFLANRLKHNSRLKRGGQHLICSLDFEDAERRYAIEPADPLTPETNFEKRWAATVLERVLDRVRAEYAGEAKAALFEHLKAALWGEQDRPTYAAVAAQLGLSEAAVKVAMFRLRQRYRELLRAEIAETVARTDEVDAEIHHFLAVLSG